jgi:hypothetical protein
LTPPPGLALSRISAEEFGRLLDVADQEFKGILRLTRYCGLDVGDSAHLKLCNLSRDRQTLYIQIAPDGRVCEIPLGQKLISYFRGLSRSVVTDAPIFPRHARMSLSAMEREFRRLVIEARVGNGTRQVDVSDLLFYFVQLPYAPTK